jgi:hypothetical protein
MKLPPVRFTVRRMIGAVAVLAVLTYNVAIPTWEYVKGPLMTRAVLTRLGRPIHLGTAGQMPLVNLLNSVERTTVGSIPVCVDTAGFRDVGANIGSPVVIGPDRMPVKRLLDDALKPLGLSYYVVDGILIITSISSAERTLRNNKGARRP